VLSEATTELSDLARTAVPLALAGGGLILLGVLVSDRRRRALMVTGVAVAGAALAVGAATWTAGAPLVPSTDALRAIAGESFTELDPGGLVARSAALFAVGVVLVIGAELLGRRRGLKTHP
jgi:hypothetical protein